MNYNVGLVTEWSRAKSVAHVTILGKLYTQDLLPKS